MALNLITDRTQADLDNARNSVLEASRTGVYSPEYMAGLKGCYNYIDLNRVESAVKVLKLLLESYGYATMVTTKTDWSHEDIFSQSDLTRYLANVQNLRSQFAQMPATPLTPNSYKPYNKANDIEKILIDIESLLIKAQAVWRYSGTFYSNQGGLI